MCGIPFEKHDHKMSLLAACEVEKLPFKLSQPKPMGVKLKRDDALMILEAKTEFFF